MYKAVHPHVHAHRVISWQEVELRPEPSGAVRVKLLFDDSARVDVTASWRRVGGFFLTSAACHASPR